MNDKQAFALWLGSTYPDLPEEGVDRLMRYGGLVRSSSIRSGLIAKGDLPRLHMRHLAECSAPEFIHAIPSGVSVADVGSGAGLPGIPLAILRPDVRVSLIESRQKRVAFLERCVLTLGLGNADVILGTVEDASLRGLGPWDVVVSRALAWTPPMVEALRAVTREASRLVRFGALGVPAEVETRPLPPDGNRAVQIWPKERWNDLDNCP